MASTNCKPQIALIYTSVTGNTEALCHMIRDCFGNEVDVSLFRVTNSPLPRLGSYDAVIIGTYTWGSGDIPKEMHSLYEAIESLGRKDLITAVFGTGDSFYPNYCGAVDRFRDMLYVQTDLAVTLKAELMPQEQDWSRCRKFADFVLDRLKTVSM